MITCTDLAVLAGGQNCEACFTKYGGLPATRTSKHEVALRLVLAATSRAAARYRRAVVPLLSLSIDFYVRVFVRIVDSPLLSKYAAARTSLVYQCGQCDTWAAQALGSVKERPSVPLFTSAVVDAPHLCAVCNGRQRLCGPLWNGPLHDPAFASRVTSELRDNASRYGSYKKALSIAYAAEHELSDVMLSYQLPSMCNTLRLTTPSNVAFR
jgi:tRNA (guanine26-N2/guanine27-N2)-dimethyltransferase